ncbi:hypothetical protein [Trichlorobacter lovleyi]|uniref:Uncharacterized protein n=1 Tax=Trichlorobacter lovleyi (strain ATCC BAA-1151 / DSM 17278 / SZ) TaxID=398767 RepID=B3E9S6_TRIL1|nr:hypothetical protein [Trichlorobacter lovleyi]ACD95352.1 hypothetical protein Glov_1636 [Trichlorobacter lovleyi SZ]
MINLLFISNSPRAELLRVHFQQILKIRIDVVEDFDHGLKDVFEKRPVTVCIQDQIVGVTGESVARHIQLLLGNAAPSFVLMHEGNAKARLISGLFNHLIDLNAPFELVCENLRKALQSLLGEQWGMVYNAPPEPEPVQPEPVADLALADQLVDDFIAETSIFNPRNAPALPTLETDSTLISDSLIERHLPGGPPAEPDAARTEPLEPSEIVPSAESPVLEHKPLVELEQQRPVRQVRQTPPAPPELKHLPVESDDGSVPVEELLQAFEENYRSRKRLIWRVCGAAVVMLLAGLLLFWMKQRGGTPKAPPPAGRQQLSSVQSQQPVVQPTVSSAGRPVAQKTDSLPSFIPANRRDAAYSNKKPGWSRYQSEKRDYRLFHADGRLKALQVLVLGDGSIAPAELKRILRELAGTDQFLVDRKELKAGVWLERAKLSGQGDLLIYRSKANGPIKAFVFARTP